MSISEIIHVVWSHITGLIGTIVMVSFLISVVVGWIERVRLRRCVKNAESNAGHREKNGAIRRVAVITGASSGLGRKYAMAIDRDPERYNVNEIWLIARREDRLKALQGELKLPSKVIPMDLTDRIELDWFTEFLACGAEGLKLVRHAAEGKDAGIRDIIENENRKSKAGNRSDFCVTLLLNCAGFGKYGSSAEIGHETEDRMIDLNDKAAISITDILLPYMVPGSRIGEVCSVAAFQPIAYFNAYAASKALLYSYSRGMRIELIRKGISVTAICPYWVKDTEFIETAAGEKRKLFLSSNSDSVVRISLHDILYNHAVSTPGIMCTVERVFAGWIPDGLLGYITSAFL